jgi:lipopolysaccharide heptosyltransferase I
VNVAIVKLSSLGDVIHALPVARALREATPEARLTWIVEVREAAILERHPDLDGVVAVDTRAWRRHLWSREGSAAVGQAIARLRQRLAAGRFDVAIDLQGLLKSGALTALTRARRRIGFAAGRCREPLSALFTNCRVTPPATARHVVEQNCALLAPLGVSDVKPVFAIPTDPVAEQRIDRFLVEAGVGTHERLVALVPTARRPQKRWPLAHVRAVADRLALEAGLRVLVVWGPGELETARLAATGLVSRPLLAPPTDLAELTALLRRCAVVVGADTGPVHLAAAAGVPAVGLYGPTRAERNGPHGPRGRGLQSRDGRMASISPAAVFEAVMEVCG